MSESFCYSSDDERHCNCWFFGKPCCYCNDELHGLAALVAAAERRAAVAVADGIAGLEQAIKTAPEWTHSERFNGTPLVIPERAMLSGMLNLMRGAQ